MEFRDKGSISSYHFLPFEVCGMWSATYDPNPYCLCCDTQNHSRFGDSDRAELFSTTIGMAFSTRPNAGLSDTRDSVRTVRLNVEALVETLLIAYILSGGIRDTC